MEVKGSSKCFQWSWNQEHNLSIFGHWNPWWPFLQCDMAASFAAQELTLWGHTDLWQTGTAEHINLWICGHLIIGLSPKSLVWKLSIHCWYWSDTFSRSISQHPWSVHTGLSADTEAATLRNGYLAREHTSSGDAPGGKQWGKTSATASQAINCLNFNRYWRKQKGVLRNQVGRCASLLSLLLQATPLQPGLKRKMKSHIFYLLNRSGCCDRFILAERRRAELRLYQNKTTTWLSLLMQE